MSTGEYYRLLNELTAERAGSMEAARLVLWSINFGDMQRNNHAGDQEANYRLVLEGLKKVEAAGAEGAMILANTLHMFADRAQAELGISIIHLIDATAEALIAAGKREALLLGTRYTMEGEFFAERLERFGIKTRIPDEPTRDAMHAAIYDEMTRGVFSEPTRELYLRCLREFAGQGVEAAILGCTEIPTLLRGVATPMDTFDTALIHAKAGVEFMLS